MKWSIEKYTDSSTEINLADDFKYQCELNGVQITQNGSITMKSNGDITIRGFIFDEENSRNAVDLITLIGQVRDNYILNIDKNV